MILFIFYYNLLNITSHVQKDDELKLLYYTVRLESSVVAIVSNLKYHVDKSKFNLCGLYGLLPQSSPIACSGSLKYAIFLEVANTSARILYWDTPVWERYICILKKVDLSTPWILQMIGWNKSGMHDTGIEF